MKTSPKAYDAAVVLHRLRDEVSDSKLGLQVQALLGHVILRTGGAVYAIRSPGHPDIIAKIEGVVLNIEVELATSKKYARQLDAGDLEVLTPQGNAGNGYFCVLDCGPPVAWLCVNVGTLGTRIQSPLRLALLRAYADQALSERWSAEFCELVLKEAKNLRHLSYSSLRQEALNGHFR